MKSQKKIETGAVFAKAPLAGAMPGVEQNREEFVTDWQLPNAFTAEPGAACNGGVKSPAPGGSLDDIGPAAEEDDAIGRNVCALLVNSLRSPGAKGAVVCSLAEFRQLASVRGVVCPTDEKACNIATVARAVSEIARTWPFGDLVVTMGEISYVVADATTRVIAHVGLTRLARERVRASLRPGKVHVSRDRFFAVFAAEHARLHGVATENSRALRAARRACLEVVRSCSRLLCPDRSWFEVRIFAERFGA